MQGYRSPVGDRGSLVARVAGVALTTALLALTLSACSPRSPRSPTDDWFLGVVEGNEVELLLPGRPSGLTVRLTTMAMQVAQPPESGEPDLSAYDGAAILFRGHDGGGWIYSVRVIARVHPTIAALLRRIVD